MLSIIEPLIPVMVLLVFVPVVAVVLMVTIKALSDKGLI